MSIRVLIVTAKENKNSRAALSAASFWSTAVDWSKVNYGGASATAAPAAATTTVAAAVHAAAEPTAQATASSSSSAAPSSSKSSGNSLSDAVGSLVGEATGDLASMVSKLSSNAAGLSIAQAVTNAAVAQGSHGPYTMQASNNKNTDMLLVCWNSNNGYSSSFVGKGATAPVLTVAIPAGKSQMISFATGSSGACSPVWEDTAATTDGQIQNTWLEYTFEPTGVVDVSREVYMSGDSIATTVESTGCKSNMDQCVFTCTSGTSCMENYQLSNCAGQNGAVPGARDGGCGWNGNANDKITAIFG